ncbi:MAG: hypothetical protein AAGB11_04455 [Pseudomonadota bacterium]
MTAKPGEPAAPFDGPGDAERVRRRRSRSLAIAVILAGLVVLFYVITILRLSGNSAIPNV